MVWYPRSFTMDRSLPFKFNGQQIEEVSETKFLGVILDNGLTWKSHIRHVRNMVSRGAGILKNRRSCVNNDTALDLYYSFIYPYFTYCVYVWGKTYTCNLDCIITLEKRVIRILAGVHPLTHTEPMFSRLKILKFLIWLTTSLAWGCRFLVKCSSHQSNLLNPDQKYEWLGCIGTNGGI